MRTVPPPLCWMTLSSAPFAPPPLIVEVPDSCLIVIASSQTASNHTSVIVHEPRQWMPSPWSAPMTTLLSDAPSSRRKTASESPPSDCPPHLVPRSKRVYS